MELELGLPSFPAKEREFEGLFEAESLIRKGNYCCSPDHHLGCLNNKGCDDQGVACKVGQQYSSGTLHNSWPLVLWAGQPNEDDDDDDRGGKRKKTSCSTSMHVVDDDKEESDVHVIVGWPPIKSWRRKMLQQPNQAGQNVRRHVHVLQDRAAGVQERLPKAYGDRQLSS